MLTAQFVLQRQFAYLVARHLFYQRHWEVTYSRRAGLLPYEARCLMELVHSQDITIKELTRRLLISPSRISRILGRLERKGLIVRRIDRSDRRSIVVRLTARGAHLGDQFMEQLSDRYSAALERIGDEMAGRLVEGLRHTLEELEKRPGKSREPGIGAT